MYKMYNIKTPETRNTNGNNQLLPETHHSTKQHIEK